MPWPSFRTKKPSQTSSNIENEDDEEEFLSNKSSPFLRGLSNARYALCGTKAACSCTTATFVITIVNIVAFCFAMFFTALPKPNAVDAIASSALLGPSQCQLAAGGGLWSSDLRHRFAVHELFSSMFLHASILHLIVSLCTLMRYGLSFEYRRSLGELIVLVAAAGILSGLVSASTVPTTVLVCGSAAAFALMGDEIVNVLFMGGCTMFDGLGNRSKRRLPYRLTVVGVFFAANVGILLFAGGTVSFYAMMACVVLGGLATASEYPSRKSRKAQIDEGQGTGDEWAFWKRSGYLVGIVSVALLFGVAILGFEGNTNIPNSPAPIC